MQTKKITVLVVDDHYAIDSSASTLSHYDKNCFLEDYSSDSFEFSFCSGFDAKNRKYNVCVVREYLESLFLLPNVILLDIMFGDEEFLGIEILNLVALEYPQIAIVIMTSKQKNELFDKTISMGAIDYLVKPLDREELHLTLYRYSVKKKHFVLGQESSFLSVVNSVVLAKKHLLIETEDVRRAISLFEYYAKIRAIGFEKIYIEKEDSVEDVFTKIKTKKINLFLGLEEKNHFFQESLYLLLKKSDKFSIFGAVCSGKITQKIKQHHFSTNLYELLGDTRIRLANIEIESKDLLLLFRYYFNLIKPKEIQNGILFSDSLLIKIFATQKSLTIEGIVKFIEGFFSSRRELKELELLAYAKESLGKESYQELQKELSRLRVAEFEILLKALQKTRESGKKSNKSLAISRLLDKPQASTNKYDRWIKKLWKEIPILKQQEYREFGYLNSLGIRF